ncbi:G-protein coupled receptor 54-like [Centruroides sculpturatus]|uniref:G-protein coupled receptor 54-like n=1 Tax=Centruroides sculpturatus TaxID=218467 RepID=UPI000C6EA651|nr:G-protein coupled receptor 54-like [Centruroides sculpturatus]
MLFVYLINFMWCWVLFQVVVLYRYFKTGDNELPKWYKHVYFCAHLLSYGHSAINPIVYQASNENFRKAARLTFPCLFRTNRIVPNVNNNNNNNNNQMQQRIEVAANCNGIQNDKVK